jgi:hypothetical protein
MSITVREAAYSWVMTGSRTFLSGAKARLRAGASGPAEWGARVQGPFSSI